jgi:Mn2+/Fe2+ NRAMP family transporter
MGDYRNSRTDNILLWACGLVVTGLNVMLLRELVSAML